MGKTIRAKFANGVIEPLEELGLTEGEEITVTITETPKRSRKNDGVTKSAGGWKGLIDAEKLKRDIYNDRLISTRPGVKLL